jgi:hypothetical protein
LAASLLAGCGAPGDRQTGANAQEPKIRIANKEHDDLLKLPPNLQRLAMMRAIRSTGNRCQRVENAGYQEEYRNMRMWVARCDVEQKSFAVYIAANADVQVRDCAEAGTLSLPRCEGLPPPMPDDSAPVFKEGAADNAFRSNSF